MEGKVGNSCKIYVPAEKILESHMISCSKREWTKEEVVEVVTMLAKKRHGLEFDAYVRLIENDDESINRCKDSDIIGLLRLIGVGTQTLAVA
jgi:hypothetical protein